MKTKVLVSIVTICLLLVILYSHKPLTVSDNGPINPSVFIQNHGYRIVEYKNQKDVVFTKEMLKGRDIELFMLMNIDIEDYLSKPITFDSFLVTNHPLDNDLSRFISDVERGFRTRYPNKTKVVILSYNGEVIGGYSSRYSTGEKLLGKAFRDIEGADLEKKMNLSYMDIRRLVEEKQKKINGEFH